MEQGNQTPGGKYPLPILPRVPAMSSANLELKISSTGVTLLKDNGSYRNRLTGGECVVDINGKIHYSRKEYKQYIQGENDARERYRIGMGGKVIKTKTPRKATNQNPGDSFISTGNKDKDKQPKQYQINKKEVSNRLHCMCNCLFSQVKQNAFLGMLTVSFPPVVSEDNAMQALNSWLTALRQKGSRIIKNYLWVSEFQDGKRLADPSKATGTIHYHLLILNRVNIVKVNRAMKVVLCNMVRDGIIKYPLAAMKRYNGVDLAKDRKTRVVTNFCDPGKRKALSFYITKYVTKNNATFKHAGWGCSRAFSAIFTGLTCTYQEFSKMNWADNCAEVPVISTKWFEFYPWITAPPVEFTGFLSQVNSHILEHKGLMN